ncbi:MAG: SPOR domain-containing protein [Gammaproteobacteria bacterium]|nr:SPOR domain-containing protein [Gammaproteobacteria bacterium]MCY4256074.1 SPOR domain-containing protein [Gammaproteobacteria bacterium]MCY4340752.1 SPOR domain-containing protein [Gammaproteobacteria bacterium]
MAKRSKRGSRGWGYVQFIVGLVLGMVLAFWVYPMLARWWTEPPDILATNPSSSPRFDFYDILERGEEVVEETRAAPAQEAAQPVAEAAAQQPGQAAAEPLAGMATATPQPSDGAAQPSSSSSSVREPQPRAVAAPGMYVLQLGAFTRQREAESLKARLALVGMNARIQPVRVDRQTYYRVRVGPTSDLDQLNADRARLQEHRFDSILLKLVQ